MAPSSSDQQNATIRALSTPEIISYILDAVCDDPASKYPTLFACSLINSSWVMEARRRLWEYCGVNTYAEPGVVIPDIYQLLEFKVSKQQEFAKHVKFLFIADHSGEEDMVMIVSDLWGGPFAELERLSFPLLEELRIEGPEPLSEWMDSEDEDCEEIDFHRRESVVLDHLTSPRLKRIMITNNHHCHDFVMSEEWLASLAKHSKGLQYFYFIFRRECISELSSESVELFLRSMESLKELRWDMESSFSKSAFHILARMSLLQLLIIPRIEEAWITDLHALDPEYYFKSLRHLDCNISAQALTQLMPLLHRMQNLTIKVENSKINMDSTDQVVKTVSYFTPTELTRLVIQPLPGATIHGEDILRIAKAAPNLNCLSMCLHTDGISLKLNGVDDEFMEVLARLLPKLQLISLKSKQTRMTERSLVSLGNHCPILRICQLTARLDFKKLLRLQRKRLISWRTLEHLSITNHDRQNQGDESTPENEEAIEKVWKLAHAIASSMPGLETAEFQSVALTEVMQEMLQTECDEDFGEDDDDYE